MPLTVVIVIVDLNRRWLLFSDIKSPISLELWADSPRAQLFEINNDNSFAVFDLDFLIR